MAKTVQLRISGRVQGVGYRAWTLSEANRRGLRGWVRNRSDGTVEAVVSGEAAQVDAMIDACRKGPIMARVDHIECKDSDETPGDGFTARPTA